MPLAVPLAVASALESLGGLPDPGGVGSLLPQKTQRTERFGEFAALPVLCDACHPENFVSKHYPDSH